MNLLYSLNCTYITEPTQNETHACNYKIDFSINKYFSCVKGQYA